MYPKHNVWWCRAREPPRALRAAAGAAAALTRHLCDLYETRRRSACAQRPSALDRCTYTRSLLTYELT